MKLKNTLAPKAKLGLAIYPNQASTKELIAYLKLAKKHNFNQIFTNLIGLTQKDLAKFAKIGAFALANDLALTVDIDQSVCALFEKQIDDFAFWKSLGITTLRLDVKFNAQQIAALTLKQNSLNISLNASDFSGIEQEIIKHPHNHHKLSASHNFYPQPLTGLSISKFEKANQLMKNAKMPISAFATLGKTGIGAWKTNHGNPTLELCRSMEIIDQYQLLIHLQDVETIILAEMFLSEKQMQAINNLTIGSLIFKYQKEAKLTNQELTILAFEHHALRGDNPDHLMFRSTISRKQFKHFPIEPKNLKPQLENGDIVILNDQAGRYKGELHIIKQKMVNDGTKNYVGKIISSQKELLNLTIPLLKFRLKEVN